MNPINLSITLLLLAIMVMMAMQYYPSYLPHGQAQWAGAAVAGIFVTVVAEAIADSVGLFPTMPKSSRYLIIVLICAATALGTIAYVAAKPSFL